MCQWHLVTSFFIFFSQTSPHCGWPPPPPLLSLRSGEEVNNILSFSVTFYLTFQVILFLLGSLYCFSASACYDATSSTTFSFTSISIVSHLFLFFLFYFFFLHLESPPPLPLSSPPFFSSSTSSLFFFTLFSPHCVHVYLLFLLLVYYSLSPFFKFYFPVISSPIFLQKTYNNCCLLMFIRFYRKRSCGWKKSTFHLLPVWRFRHYWLVISSCVVHWYHVLVLTSNHTVKLSYPSFYQNSCFQHQQWRWILRAADRQG